MIYTQRIKQAMDIAFKAHSFQIDKGGYPYIAHPLHLAEQCNTESETIVALLHDVIEDSVMSRKDVRQLATDEEMDAIDILTRWGEETYDEYIYKVSMCPLARKIKILDLKHNLDETRLPRRMSMSLKDKYLTAYQKLISMDC